MIGGHESYKPFDPDNLFKEDGPDATVKNRFLNRCFVYILYESCIIDTHSCLSWVLPVGSSEADIKRVIERTIPAGDGTSNMIPFFGPEIAASVAAAIMWLPWHTFHGVKNPPPYLEWYAKHLRYFGRFRREAIAERIRLLLTEFFAKFPDAHDWKGSRRKSLGPMGTPAAEDDKAFEDASCMPP